jgi:hypothetical protein
MLSSKLFSNKIFSILFIGLNIITTSLSAQTIFNSTVSGSGIWKNNANWSQASFPPHNTTTNSHVININNNHTITLTDILSVKNGTIINVTDNDTLKIIGDVIFANGAVLNIDTLGVMIIVGNVTNNNNSNTITVNGILDIDGNFDGGNGSEIGGTGSMPISGDVTTSGSGSVFGSTVDCSSPTDCSSSFGTPLPIELISFNATINDSKVNINWQTASEINNDYFTIEKSADALNWKAFAEQSGAGNSNTTLYYSGIDFTPYQGISYYRLKQTDFNGAFEYSKIAVINISKKSNITAYPNPVKEMLILTNIDVSNTVKVYASNGQLIYNGNSATINTSKWAKGLYQIIILDIDGQQLDKIKIVK